MSKWRRTRASKAFPPLGIEVPPESIANDPLSLASMFVLGGTKRPPSRMCARTVGRGIDQSRVAVVPGRTKTSSEVGQQSAHPWRRHHKSPRGQERLEKRHEWIPHDEREHVPDRKRNHEWELRRDPRLLQPRRPQLLHDRLPILLFLREVHENMLTLDELVHEPHVPGHAVQGHLVSEEGHGKLDVASRRVVDEESEGHGREQEGRVQEDEEGEWEQEPERPLKEGAEGEN